MANIDNPNGFTAVGENTGTHKYKRKAGGAAIAKGDAVIKDAANDVMTSDGFVYVTIATSGSTALLGTAANDCPANDSIDGEVDVYDHKECLFEGQCSGDPTGVNAKMVACDIEGTTGIMEINEDAEVTKVISIIGLKDAPGNVAGTNARVIFKILSHQ